ncbi:MULTISPECIES: MFS transporter [Pseudomonas]|uniref:MFS transporter n=1 Tax=Pseudomonas sp. Hg7Tf TaxID=3236988 RepID=A0AB39HX57_9PSED|nr:MULTISPECIES: MFS transporter [unclassified Pseudomonas]MDH2559275.1 MFS transporter [Pseudomonas sp. Hg5Tf]QYX49831.1 MFS transporter [Pseudomonas sp. S11A 273]
MSQKSDASVLGEQPWLGVSRHSAWYAVCTLLLAYVFSIMDRQILTLLVGPIQHSLGVSDTLMGLLHGFTFAAFYAVVGMPIARLVDHGNRRMVIAVGIALWCLATAAGGLASDYWHLLLARIGVAVGEAVLIPGTVSLLADLFPPHRRGKALGIFGAAGPFGAGAGLLIGGTVLGVFTAAAPTLPLLGKLEAWQLTFLTIGLPGLLIALMVTVIPEPRTRKNTAQQRMAGASQLPFSEVMAFLRSNRRSYSALMLGGGFFYMGVYAMSSWVPTFFVREFAWTYAEIGKQLGLFLCFLGPLGALVGSWLGDYWRKRGVMHGNLRVAVVGGFGLTLSSSLMLLMPTAQLALIFLAISCPFWFIFFGAGPAAIQESAPAPMRGQFAAMYTGMINLLGAGLGPVAVGLLTDHVLHDLAAIKYAMLIVCLLSGLLACFWFSIGFTSFRHTERHAAVWKPKAVTPAQNTMIGPRHSPLL